MIKVIIKKIWKILRNPFIFSTAFFIVWVSFFDNDNIISHFKQRKELNRLLEQKKYYTGEIEKNKTLLHQLTSNVSDLERYGREKYLMKKEHEDLFLVIADEEPNK